MPIPFLWIGAGAAIFAGVKVADKRHSALTGAAVVPVDGAIVSCGIFGVFEHTGVWLDGNIIELKGNGLIRAISAARFLAQRSGELISVACNEKGEPLVAGQAAERAVSKLYQYSEYDVLKNNCHRFVWHCISGSNEPLTRFSDLHKRLEKHFHCQVCWPKAELER
jgi:hypothetical protein